MASLTFKEFVQGIPKDLSPFVIEKISPQGDTGFHLCISVAEDPSAEDPQQGIAARAEAPELGVFIEYSPEFLVLSFGMSLITEVPSGHYGWTLDYLNDENTFGHGHISKVRAALPEDPDDPIRLAFSWEVELPEQPFFRRGSGVDLLTFLHHNLRRMCEEALEGVENFNDAHACHFPHGKLDA